MLKKPTDLILDDSWPSRSPATMPRDAKAWKLKRLLSHNEEPFETENLGKKRFSGTVISHESRNSEGYSSKPLKHSIVKRILAFNR